MNTTPTTRRVRLKRVLGLQPGDTVLPGMGLFRRDGTRMASQKLMTDAWGRLAFDVTGVPWINDVPEMNVPVVCDGDPSTESILHTPLDAYVVLAPKE